MYTIWVEYIKDLFFDRSSMKYLNYHFEQSELIDLQKKLLTEMDENDEGQKNETDESGDKEKGLN